MREPRKGESLGTRMRAEREIRSASVPFCGGLEHRLWLLVLAAWA